MTKKTKYNEDNWADIDLSDEDNRLPNKKKGGEGGEAEGGTEQSEAPVVLEQLREEDTMV